MDPQPPTQSSSPPPPSPNLEQRVLEQDNIPDQPIEGFGWEASEYVAHHKPALWYAGLFLATVVFAGGLAWFHQWTGTALIVVMALAIVVYTRKEPRTLHYQVDDEGIHIEDRVHSYHFFKSYSLQPEVGWREIDLEPAKRFSQRLTLLCEEEDFDHIEAVLIQHLPRVDREPDFVEKLTRYLKF